jgi:hypothetical protein
MPNGIILPRAAVIPVSGKKHSIVCSARSERGQKHALAVARHQVRNAALN